MHAQSLTHGGSLLRKQTEIQTGFLNCQVTSLPIKVLHLKKRELCQVEIIQGSKEQCALSPSHKLDIHPNGLNHQGWASSGELLGSEGTSSVPVSRAKSRGTWSKGKGGYGQSGWGVALGHFPRYHGSIAGDSGLCRGGPGGLLRGGDGRFWLYRVSMIFPDWLQQVSLAVGSAWANSSSHMGA